MLIHFAPVNGKVYLFDFATIFDLQYRFLPVNHNIKLYALTVGGSELPAFADRISGLFKPALHKTVLLYGFDKHYSENALPGVPGNVIALSLARPLLYEKLLSNARSAGVIVQELTKEDDFWDWFIKGKENYMLQLVAHYRQRSNDKKGRLYFKHTSLRFDILEHKLGLLAGEDRLRNDIIIDAVTCTNFFDFRSLYSKGIKYMYLSHHDFDTDQAAFVLNEMYTGVNAKKLNYGFEYLNGKNHLHEVRSQVYRCFFALAREGELIITP
jgi:hypothetical protein